MNFGRMWQVEIDGEVFVAAKDVPQLRVEFDVTVAHGNTISFADIRITNLAKVSTIRQGAHISLSAGYKDSYDVIFTGNVTNSLKERNGTDIITRLLCRSGEPYSGRLSCTASYGKNVRVVDVIKSLAAAWPRQLEMDESQFDNAPRMTSGYSVNGDIPSALNELKYAFKFEWTQHNGKLIVNKRTYPRKTGITEVNQFTGMVGMPEVSLGSDGLGVFVVTALDPHFAVWGRINVTSEFATFNTGNLFISANSGDASANGEYNIMALRHRGDSHGSQWTTEIEGIRPGIVTEQRPASAAPLDTVPKPVTPDNGTLVWGMNVDQDFRNKTREIATKLGFDPNWLMAVMAFETGRSFSPSEKNPAGSATGLIQFTESTARGLGTTTRDLARMTAVQQLDYVYEYFKPSKSKINNLGDCYMCVLWPRGMGKPDTYIMWVKDDPVTGKYYNANAGLDTSKDGTITRGEAVARVNRQLKDGRNSAK